MTAQADQTQASGQKEVLVLDPARSIIDRLGGAHAVAAMTGRHVTRVRRWTYPRERRGSDGVIPLPEAMKIIEQAPARGITGLTMEDFIHRAGSLTRDDLRILSMMLDGKSLKEIATTTNDSQKRLRDVEIRLRSSTVIGPDVWALIERRREMRAADRK
jgi:hypothetical protein